MLLSWQDWKRIAGRLESSTKIFFSFYIPLFTLINKAKRHIRVNLKYIITLEVY